MVSPPSTVVRSESQRDRRNLLLRGARFCRWFESIYGRSVSQHPLYIYCMDTFANLLLLVVFPSRVFGARLSRGNPEIYSEAFPNRARWTITNRWHDLRRGRGKGGGGGWYSMLSCDFYARISSSFGGYVEYEPAVPYTRVTRFGKNKTIGAQSWLIRLYDY